MTSKQIIGITGYKGHGKDTFARAVQEFNPLFKVVHFADELKRQASEIFRLAPDHFEKPELKEQALAFPIEFDSFLEEMCEVSGLDIQPIGKTAFSPRQVLQYYGTECVRAAQDNYWVQKVVDFCASNDKVLIPDLRFKNEVAAVQAMGGKVIRIHRVDLPPNTDRHSSETELDNVPPTFTVGVVTGNLTVPRIIARLVAEGAPSSHFLDHKHISRLPKGCSLEQVKDYLRLSYIEAALVKEYYQI